MTDEPIGNRGIHYIGRETLHILIKVQGIDTLYISEI